MRAGQLPSVSIESGAFDAQAAKANCAMCLTLTAKGLYPQHPDLQEDQDVQQVVRHAFMERMEDDEESFTCPFPGDESCRQSKSQRRAA